MRWIAIFSDSPAMIKARDKQNHAAHLAYLRDHPTEILIAGPLREQHGGPIIGGLWVMEVPNRERAVQLVEGDPYFALGYRTYQLRTWDKALGDRPATL
jgi:hypothetical protein